MEFAIAGGVDVGEGGTGRDEALWIGDAFRGAEDLEELIALPANAAEKTELLEDKSPGDQGDEEKDGQYGARDQTGLRKNLEDIADEECG